MFYSTVLAAIGNPVVTNGDNPDGVTFIGEFLPRILTLVFIVGGIAFFFMFLIGAVRWITSGGDKAQVESARSQITQALTGLVVMFSIWAIATLIKTVFGVDLIHIDLTTLLP